MISDVYSACCLKFSKFDRAKSFFTDFFLFYFLLAAAAVVLPQLLYVVVVFCCWVEQVNVKRKMWKQKYLISGNDFDGPWRVAHLLTFYFYFYHIYSSESEPNTIPLFSFGEFVSVCVLSTIFSIIMFSLFSSVWKKKSVLVVFFLFGCALMLLLMYFIFLCEIFCFKMLWTDRVGSRHLLHRKICCWINNKERKKTQTFSDAKCGRSKRKQERERERERESERAWAG